MPESRVPDEETLCRLGRALAKTHAFEDEADFLRFHAEAPWRVVVGPVGDVAVVERWRRHLDILAIRGIWCRPGEVPDMLRRVGGVARERGFGSLVSPLLSATQAAPYRRAGMRVRERIVRYASRLPLPGVPPDAETVGIRRAVRVRRAAPGDLDAVARLDARCFEEFWRYDIDVVERRLREGGALVLEVSGRPWGFSLFEVDGSVGTLGRLGVDPDARGKGWGRTLVETTATEMARAGATRLSLCTQAENHAAKRLYRAVGLGRRPGRLLLLDSDKLDR